MAKKLLASVIAFALCLFVSAADMVVKEKNGEDRKINVVDQSKTFLEFKVLSDSTVEVTITPSYRGHKSITIPEKVRIEGKVYTVTSIGYFAFKECSSLTSIKIPEGVTSIGGSAFEGCSSLTSINIPESVTSIGKSAFSGCERLTGINIPESVTSIGGSAFERCSNLDIVIDNSEKNVKVGAYAFTGCKSVTWLKD